jgi:hypothetical protein
MRLQKDVYQGLKRHCLEHVLGSSADSYHRWDMNPTILVSSASLPSGSTEVPLKNSKYIADDRSFLGCWWYQPHTLHF